VLRSSGVPFPQKWGGAGRGGGLGVLEADFELGATNDRTAEVRGGGGGVGCSGGAGRRW